jgi:RNA polymerase sigma factor (sigma-70 family)
MVLRVCQRVLGNRHDAEDAFQATFLVLARKAASVRSGGALAAWLHGVACRVAQGARLAGSRRRLREAPAPDLDSPDPHPDPLSELTAREALQILDEEVQQLPQAYRLPVILCCLEGLSQEEAARQLGWTPGSVKGRLERGRKRLQQRLTRRGLQLTAALALVEVSRAAAAGPVGMLVASTARAAMAFAAGDSVGVGCVPVEVTTLAEQGLRGMAVAKAKGAIVAALLLALVAAGAGVWAHQAPAAKQAPQQPDAGAQRVARPEPDKPRPPHTDRLGDPLPPGAVARVGSMRWWSGPTNDAYRFCPLAYAPDGKSLASCDGGKAVRFLDTATGKELCRFEPAGEGVTCFALAPDGKTLVTASSHSSVLRLWDVAAVKELGQLAGDKDGTAAVAFSPDGKRFAAAKGNTGIRLWDAATWKEISRLTEENAGWSLFLAFLSDGKTLITGNGAAIRWWDVGTGQVVRRLDKDFPPGSGFYELAVSPDGKRLAVLVQSGVLRLWDAATGSEVRRIALNLYGSGCLCFSADGQTLACGNAGGRRQNETVFFAADTGRELRRWNDDDRGTTHMAFSPDGKVLAQATSRVLRLRDATTGKPLGPTSGLPGSVLALRFAQDGNTLIASCMGGRTGLWDPLTGKPLAPSQDPPKDFSPCMELYPGTALTADGRKAALIDGKGVLHVWETATGRACCRIADPPPLDDRAVFSADGQLVAIGHRDYILRLWDTTTGTLVRSLPQTRAVPYSHALAFSADGRLLATYASSTTAFEDRAIRVWDTTTGNERGRFPWPEDTNPDSLVFTADGQRLIASYDPQWAEGMARERIGLCVWDLATARELRRFRGPAGAIALSPDERTLAAADHSTIHLWELASGKERGRFSGHRERIRALAFSPDGRLLVSGGLDYTALVWDVTGMCPEGKWSTRDLRPGEIERLWADLGGEDGAAAYRAVWALAAARQAVPFLAERLRPMPGVEDKRLTRLIAELDSEQFEVRNRAAKELEQLGELAEPALRKALAGKPSVEVRRQLKLLLDQLASRNLSAEQLKAPRAVEVLEQLGTPAARQVLEELTTGAFQASLTREARASLERLARRYAAKP